MKSTKVFYFCVTLFSTMVNSRQSIHYYSRIIKEISNQKGELVNDVFEPMEYINSGNAGFTFKGILHPRKIEVAMKFTLPCPGADAKNEYKIYSYLNAINRTEIESYGIPCIYYYGQWKECQMIGMSLLNPEFSRRYKGLIVNDLDVLILCREFVRISKYIHSCGVCHNDIKTNNIMFRADQGFIMDFNVASPMYESSSTNPQINCISSDWNRFYTMLLSYRFQIDWDEMKNKSQSTDLQRIALKRIIREIAKNIFEVAIPDSDSLYKMINDEIDKWQPALVSWLTPQEIADALNGTRKTLSSIANMKIPKQSTDIKYPKVKYDYFS